MQQSGWWLQFWFVGGSVQMYGLFLSVYQRFKKGGIARLPDWKAVWLHGWKVVPPSHSLRRTIRLPGCMAARLYSCTTG